MKEQRRTATVMVALSLLVIMAFGPGLAIAQEKTAAETNMEILREKLEADKKLVVAANLVLTDAEAEAFWPMYEDYQKELHTLQKRLVKAINSYAEGYNANTMTDESSMKLLEETIAIDEAGIQMRKDFIAKLSKVLPGKKVTRYMQIENKIRALIKYELAAEIPLME